MTFNSALCLFLLVVCVKTQGTCDTSKWQPGDSTSPPPLNCGKCRAFTTMGPYKTCDEYCAKQGLGCLRAYEDLKNSCEYEDAYRCDFDFTTLGTSDFICKCTEEGNVQTPSSQPSSGGTPAPPPPTSKPISPTNKPASSPSSGSSSVEPADVKLLPVPPSKPLLGGITIANYEVPCPFDDKHHYTRQPGDPHCEKPIYTSFDSDTDEYYDNAVDEQLLARLDANFLLVRGCSSKDSDSTTCGYTFDRWVKAVQRADAVDVLKFAIFDDNNSWNGLWWRTYFKNQPKAKHIIDMSDIKAWQLIYSSSWAPAFQTIPKSMWFRLEGKPVIAIWNLRDDKYQNGEGNIGKFIRWAKARFAKEFGVEPQIITPDSISSQKDPSFKEEDLYCQHSWFSAAKGSSWSWKNSNGKKCGAIAPGYREHGSISGCGADCREVSRRGGQNLIDALKAGRGGDFALLEGWFNVRENAGFYRSPRWAYPNQYINIIRNFADPAPPTLRFQAEAADSFQDTTKGNTGGKYRAGDLDIAKIQGGGFYVGWTVAGEWLQFENVKVGCGTYRFTARVSTTTNNQRIGLQVSQAQQSPVTVANTKGSWANVHLAQVDLGAGEYNFRVNFVTGRVDLDWFFLRRSSTACSNSNNNFELNGDDAPNSSPKDSLFFGTIAIATLLPPLFWL